MKQQAVEHVARAFYEAEGDGPSWDSEPEILKEEFRRLARGAMALLRQQMPEQLTGVSATPANLPDVA